MRSRRAPRLLVSALAGGAALAAAVGAHAATVQVAAGTLSFAAPFGEANSVSIVPSGSDYLVDDSVALVIGAGCVAGGDATQAICAGAGVTSVEVSTSDMNDVVQVSVGVPTTVYGGDGNDVLRGGAAGETFYGENGNDTFDGGGGNDLLIGGPGNDTFEGEGGNDTILGGPDDDTISGGDDDDVLDGGPGADAITGGNGTDWVDYSSRSTPLAIDLLDPARDGGVEDGIGDGITEVENVRGGSANDVIVGDNGPNALDGGPGADVLDGGGDVDVVDYSLRTTPVTVDLADPGADGGAEDGAGDQLASIEGANGGAANDVLRAGAGTNALSGGPGDDLLDGGAGADLLVGGDGVDTVDYSARVNPVTADLDGAADDGEAGEGDRIETDVEVIVGGSGNDSLTGNNGANALYGGPGNDQLAGGFGADLTSGGDGVDQVSYASRTSAVTVTLDDVANDGEPGEGDDVRADVENVLGGSGADVLRGSAGANTLNGGPGNDVLDGGAGPDVLTGGIGVDTVDYSARTASVTVDIDGVADDGEAGELDNVGADVEGILGGAGDDVLRGSGGPNTIAGGAGNDTIDPLSGQDSVDGGPGNDTITTTDGVSDQIACGGGVDAVAKDNQDVLAGDCENTTLVTGGSTGGSGSGTGGGPSGDSPPAQGGADIDVEDVLQTGTDTTVLVRSGEVLQVSAAGALTIRVACPRKAKATCKGSITLQALVKAKAKKGAKPVKAKKRKPAKVVIGKASFTVARGRVIEVPIRLTRKGMTLLKKLVKVKAVVRSTSKASGKKRTRTLTVVLRAPKTVKAG
ncbi:MAG: calcium-binding protein [Thermoleophilia bacterium]